MSGKTVDIILDSSGCDNFIMVCKNDTILYKNIEYLIESPAYKDTIKSMGRNWGMPNKKQWIETFCIGLSCNDINIKKESLSDLQLIWANHIKEARNRINDVYILKEQIERAVDNKEFIEIANKYIPSNPVMDKLDVNILIFGPNAGGCESVIMDALFMDGYSDDEITRILAHELHHILRGRIEKSHCWKEDHEDIEQVLYWFESEGIADLCNFKETSKIYEKYGYAKLGELENTLKNMKSHINVVNDIMISSINKNNNSSQLFEYLFDNVKFHAIGFFMAKTIEEVLGVEAIKKVVGDPISFMNMYQKSCKLDRNKREYAFSDSLIASINDYVI